MSNLLITFVINIVVSFDIKTYIYVPYYFDAQKTCG